MRRAPQEMRREEAIERLFGELHQALECASLAGGPGGEAGSLPSLRLSKPSPLPEGTEFLLEGKNTRVRFLNPMTGFVFVTHEVEGVPAREEILSVQIQGGDYRPIQKLLRGKKRGAPCIASQRSAFRFTSVPELARAYVHELKETYPKD